MFNLLDASGGIGVTERTAYILRVRQLAVAIAKADVGRRREPEPEPRSRRMDRELLIEIGVEELPAGWLPALTRAARASASARG